MSGGPPEPTVSPALAYRHALDDAREASTIRLRLRERRLRRRAHRRSAAAAAGTGPAGYVPGERNELAAWAAIRRGLAERGVDLPDTDHGAR